MRRYVLVYIYLYLFKSLFQQNKMDALFREIARLITRKVRKRTKIRNRYNQAPRLTQDTNGKVIMSHLDITNESQEVSPFTAGDYKASTNRRA